MWPRIIAFQPEIIVRKSEDRLDVRIYYHAGKRSGSAGKLEASLSQMILIEMSVARCVDEFSGLKTSNLGHHH